MNKLKSYLVACSECNATKSVKSNIINKNVMIFTTCNKCKNKLIYSLWTKID